MKGNRSRYEAAKSVADVRRTCKHPDIVRLSVTLYECLLCGLRAEVPQERRR